MQSLAKINSGELKNELQSVENSADKKTSSSLLISIQKLMTIGLLFVAV